MPRNKPDHPAEPDFLARIGLDDAPPFEPDDLDLWEDLRGDLSGVLRARFADLIRRHAFAPGDLVTWKPGLKNKRLPAYGVPAVVVAVLAAPVYDGECDGGSTYAARQGSAKHEARSPR